MNATATGTMLAMPGTRAEGRAARLTILRELRRRERTGARPPSLDELGETLGLSSMSALRHVRRLIDAGMVTNDPARYRSWALTDKGRGVADGI